MFGRSIKLFEVLGFTIKLDPSWFIVFFLVAWSLSSALFPQLYPELGTTTYWLMGIIGSLALFVSVVVHELSHSLIARRYGLPMRGITLFLFGGVAEMSDEPPSAKAELMVAIAGPMASIVIAVVCQLGKWLAESMGMPVPVTGVLGYLAAINVVLVVFNILPAFPLDGGRVLRSILWQIKDDLRWATRWSSRIGQAFGFGFIALGLIQVFAGNLVGGLWIGLIGMFLNGAARASYQQVQVRRMLEGEPASRFMRRDVVTVPANSTVEDLVDEYIYRHHFKMFPVVDKGDLVGCVSLKQVRDIPRERWRQETVGSLAAECNDDNSITADADSMQALAKMRKSGNSRLLVLGPHHELEGILSLKDLLEFFQLKTELEGRA
jgi:Zn-dependent protease/predicted transcriptional regulator